MNISRIAVSFIITLSVFAPFSVSAATVSASATVQTATRAQLQAEIQALLAQVQILQAQLAKIQAATTVTSSTGTKTNVTGSTTVSSSASSAASTLVVSSVPLLSGGIANAGASVPVSYLQITNTGKTTVTLTGFQIIQNGSASVQSVIGLTTVDDKGGSRGSVGGTEGATPFTKNVAVAPTDAIFAPGQMKLFTIKAVLTKNVGTYIGKQLMIDVTGLVTDAGVKGNFPIRGTTWTIAY